MDGEVRPRVRRPCRGPPSCFPCPRSRRRACKEEEASEGGWGGGRGGLGQREGWRCDGGGGDAGLGDAGPPSKAQRCRGGWSSQQCDADHPGTPRGGRRGRREGGGQQGRGEPMRDPQGAAGGEGGDGGRGKTAQHPQSTAPELRLKASPPLPEVGGGCEPPLC